MPANSDWFNLPKCRINDDAGSDDPMKKMVADGFETDR